MLIYFHRHLKDSILVTYHIPLNTQVSLSGYCLFCTIGPSMLLVSFVYFLPCLGTRNDAKASAEKRGGVTIPF
jgi:hypothetical protein